MLKQTKHYYPVLVPKGIDTLRFIMQEYPKFQGYIIRVDKHVLKDMIRACKAQNGKVRKQQTTAKDLVKCNIYELSYYNNEELTTRVTFSRRRDSKYSSMRIEKNPNWKSVTDLTKEVLFTGSKKVYDNTFPEDSCGQDI